MADAGIGEAAAAEGAKSAGEAAAGATAAGVGAETAGAAGLGGALGGAATAGAVDAASAAVLGDVGAGLTGVGAGLGSGAAGLAGVAGDAALTGIGAGFGGDLASTFTPGLISSASGAGAGASGVSGVAGGAGGAPNPADVAGTTAGGNSYIPAVNSVQPLSSDAMSSLGISNAGGVPVAQGGGVTGSFTSAVPQAASDAAAGNLGGASFGQEALDWISKNGLKTAELGLLGKNMMATPNTSGIKQLQANSQPAAAFGNNILAGGGQMGATQKQAIDDSINQQLQQGIEQIRQNAQNAGQGSDSNIIDQRIQQFKQQLETQREQLYMQAQQQNVSQALSAIGVSNQGLGAVAQQQFAQDQQAQSAMGTTASLIGKLNALGGTGSGNPA